MKILKKLTEEELKSQFSTGHSYTGTTEGCKVLFRVRGSCFESFPAFLQVMAQQGKGGQMVYDLIRSVSMGFQAHLMPPKKANMGSRTMSMLSRESGSAELPKMPIDG